MAGSTRFTTTPTWAYMGLVVALAPFGEPYASGGTPQINFTGQRRLEASDMWDFPAREEHSMQGRLISPDKAGLAGVDITDPQTWNRYAYARGNPLALMYPMGLDGERPAGRDSAVYGQNLAAYSGLSTASADALETGAFWTTTAATGETILAGGVAAVTAFSTGAVEHFKSKPETLGSCITKSDGFYS